MKTPEKTILVVDDDPVNIQTFNELLLSGGQEHRLLNANQGELALRIASSFSPDVVITDWEMPGMSGVELVKRLKQNPDTQDIPVIIASGIMLTSDHLNEALAAGAVDYIRKPIDPIELSARLRTVMEMREYILELKQKSQIISEQETVLLQQKVERLQQELDFKQRELTSNISFLMQLENEKEAHLEALGKLNPYLNAEGKRQLQALKNDLKNSNNKQSLLELENRFDDINFSFYESLEKAVPDITRNEKLLCAYLRMNLSPGEIAGITGKNTNAVNVSFSRIRGKFRVDDNTRLKKRLLELAAGA